MSRNSESSSLTGSWVKLNQVGTTVGLTVPPKSLNLDLLPTARSALNKPKNTNKPFPSSSRMEVTAAHPLHNTADENVNADKDVENTSTDQQSTKNGNEFVSQPILCDKAILPYHKRLMKYFVLPRSANDTIELDRKMECPTSVPLLTDDNDIQNSPDSGIANVTPTISINPASPDTSIHLPPSSVKKSVDSGDLNNKVDSTVVNKLPLDFKEQLYNTDSTDLHSKKQHIEATDPLLQGLTHIDLPFKRHANSTPLPATILPLEFEAEAEAQQLTQTLSQSNQSFDVINSNVSLVLPSEATRVQQVTTPILKDVNPTSQIVSTTCLDCSALKKHCRQHELLQSSRHARQATAPLKLERTDKMVRSIVCDPTALFRSFTKNLRASTSAATHVNGIRPPGRTSNNIKKARLAPPHTPPNTPTVRSEPSSPCHNLEGLLSPSINSVEPPPMQQNQTSTMMMNQLSHRRLRANKPSKTDCQVSPVSSSWASVQLILREAARDNIPYLEGCLSASEWSSPLYPGSPYPELRDLKDQFKDTDWIWDWSNGVPGDLFGDDYTTNPFYCSVATTPSLRRRTISLRNSQTMKMLLFSSDWFPWLLITNIVSLAIGTGIGIYLGIQWYQHRTFQEFAM